eukprot:3228450-Pyramimonas_sp.AAC.1
MLCRDAQCSASLCCALLRCDVARDAMSTGRCRKGLAFEGSRGWRLLLGGGLRNNCAMRSSATQRVLSIAVPRDAMQCHVVLCCAVPRHSIFLWCAMPWYTSLASAT